MQLEGLNDTFSVQLFRSIREQNINPDRLDAELIEWLKRSVSYPYKQLRILPEQLKDDNFEGKKWPEDVSLDSWNWFE